jgi:flavin reductase (DIM6/NTAB) family NADH-FMN oxidoreductase RutF
MPLFRSTAGHLLVREALAAFECAPEQHLTIGDHVIFVLRVTDVYVARPAAPLMFFGGGYGSFLPDERHADALFGGADLAMGWG